MARRKKIRICEECGNYYRARGGLIHWCEDCDTRRFVRRSKSVHGEKYDYCLAEYSKAHEEVKIICPEHGVFLQSAIGHVSGNGCSECGGSKKMTNKTFVIKAKKVHGEKYGYEEVNYVNSKTRVRIRCKIHGFFEQVPNSHLSGRGCPSCAKSKKLTTPEFISRAVRKHGTRYDYSEVEYTNTETKIKIICKIHGCFYQSPDKHLGGNGCPVCAKKRRHARHTTENFIKKAKKKHGEKYNYEKVKYVNSRTKVKIICKTHGCFYQRPVYHLGGRGCPVCAKKRNTTETFIQKALDVHGNRYGYDEVVFVTVKDPVKIRCKIHGIFEQAPYRHLKGRGCKECRTKRLTTEIFVQKAEEKHGEKYNYEKVKYVNSRTKVKVICKIHGPFYQDPYRHLKGSGCPDCAKKRHTTETFIQKAEEKHGGKYNYEKVKYVNRETKVKIICKTHGIFEQLAGSHLRGQGCAKCALERIRSKRLKNSPM